jgi:hypothetical protein
MAPRIQRRTDPWPEERQGYDQPTPVAYAPVHETDVESEGTGIRRAEQLGSLVAGAGVIWTAYAFTHHTPEILRFDIFPPGPLEVLGVGVLIWLLAKWFRAVKPH